MKNPFLIGTKVYLRPLESEDAPLLVPWVNDVEVTRTLASFHRPLNLQTEVEFIERSRKDEQVVVFGIAAKKTDMLIGATGLHQINWRDRHAEFGIFIGQKSAWGQGYGTEVTVLITGYAFETLNLHRVWLRVQEDNVRGVKAYEKVGFHQEGILRQHKYREGRYHNVLVMGILQEEWRQRR